MDRKTEEKGVAGLDLAMRSYGLWLIVRGSLQKKTGIVASAQMIARDPVVVDIAVRSVG